MEVLKQRILEEGVVVSDEVLEAGCTAKSSG